MFSSPVSKLVIIFFFLWSVVTQTYAQDNFSAVDSGNKNETKASLPQWEIAKNILNSFQFQGFASQAFIATSDNDVFGNTDEGGSFGFTEAGLNASFRPTPRLQLSAQMLSRRAGKGNDGTPRLDYGFLDYRLFSHVTNQLGIRVGRIKNPFGFYNETRDVAFTRPSILLPQSIYFDRTRNLGLSSNSVQLYGETSHSTIGNFSVQVGLTSPIVSNKETVIAITGSTRGSFSPEPSFIGRGMYESHDSRLRLAISGIWLNMDYKPGIGDPLGPGSFLFTPVFLSAQYNAENWSITSEYALRHFNFKNFNHPLFDDALNNTSGESFYIQGVYRFSPKWEVMLRYDVLFADKKDRNGSKWHEEWGQRLGKPAHTRFAKDFTVGLRWNIKPEIMARLEYHRVNGTAWLSELDNPDSLDTSQHWNLFAAQLSFRF